MSKPQALPPLYAVYATWTNPDGTEGFTSHRCTFAALIEMAAKMYLDGCTELSITSKHTDAEYVAIGPGSSPNSRVLTINDAPEVPYL